MKFYEKRSFALVVLVLAIVASSVYGIWKKPAELPEVEYHNWIYDESGALDGQTKDTIRRYNDAWDQAYGAVVAVAAVEDTRGRDAADFAAELGGQWGLGANDMLLLLVEDDHYYVALGDNAAYVMTDTHQSRLRNAVEQDYYDGDYSAAAVSFFRQADVFYAQTLGQGEGAYADDMAWESGSQGGSEILVNLVVVLVILFVIWSLLDGVRYNRYRRRYARGIITRPYLPIFWGRPRRTVVVNNNYSGRPRASHSSPSRSSSGFGSSGFGGGSRSSRPSRPTRSSSTRRSGGFGSKGFGGGKR